MGRPQSMDNATFENGFTGAISGASFNQLARSKPTVSPSRYRQLGGLAGRQNRTFNLRKGVTFHNGKSVEAEDVLASFQRHMGKDSKSAAKSLLDQIVSLKADGKHAVVFELKGGTDFPFVASDYHIAIKPSKDGKIDPVGTAVPALTCWKASNRACARYA